MRRIDLSLPWPGVRGRIGDISALIGGENSRLSPQMRRVHQSRCARALAVEQLAEIGIETDAIRKGPAGEPVWPEVACGSLAHTGQFAAAVVARTGQCLSLGIDIEPAVALPGETGTLVLGDEESEWFRAVEDEEPGADRLVFCAKECVHKAIFPINGAWLEFREVRIRFDTARGRFWPEPISDKAQAAFAGLAAEGCILREQAQYILILALTAKA